MEERLACGLDAAQNILMLGLWWSSKFAVAEHWNFYFLTVLKAHEKPPHYFGVNDLNETEIQGGSASQSQPRKPTVSWRTVQA